MIKTFIFVEDGSVDLDELKNSVGNVNTLRQEDVYRRLIASTR